MLLRALSRGARGAEWNNVRLTAGRFYTTDLGEVLGPRRAIVYKNNGDPIRVLYSTTNSHPVPLGADQILIRFLMAPINPADVSTGSFSNLQTAAIDILTAAQYYRGDVSFSTECYSGIR
jgi:hypothetical protein